jgi:predicted phage terminase large subunit-like protein
VDALERLRKKLGSYSFAALYQQRPVPAEGGLFKRAWFRNIIPQAPEGLRWCRGYDLAVNNTSSSDYTASYRTAYDREGNLYIDGGFRRRMEYPEQRKYILGRIRDELDTLQHCIELSANGNAVIQDLRRETFKLGRALRGLRAEGSKISRALPWIALAEAGKVFLIRGAWNTEFIDEACSFPAGTHDDQIDAVSIAVKMTRPRIGGRCWSM